MNITTELISWWKQLLSVLATFRIYDFLDICFVTIIVYSLIKLIRETRAIQLMKGIILIVIAYIITKLLHMETMTYILYNVLKWGVLALVILFQPELRHALEQIGRSSFKRKINFLNFISDEDEKLSKRVHYSIEAVCKACSDMSDKKIGALIVFERDTMLGEIIKTGTVIDANATSELIKNIFFPKSPLHDGAMIIREGKIYAAGCILPLTQNNSISRDLGTRHRAALGMSEASDSIVVTVSEETGAISIAEKGKLQRGLSDGDLRDSLNRSLMKELVSDSVNGKFFFRKGLKK